MTLYLYHILAKAMTRDRDEYSQQLLGSAFGIIHTSNRTSNMNTSSYSYKLKSLLDCWKEKAVLVPCYHFPRRTFHKLGKPPRKTTTTTPPRKSYTMADDDKKWYKDKDKLMPGAVGAAVRLSLATLTPEQPTFFFLFCVFLPNIKNK